MVYNLAFSTRLSPFFSLTKKQKIYSKYTIKVSLHKTIRLMKSISNFHIIIGD